METLLPILLVLLIIVNFAISWWNAYAAGKSWAEAKHFGGWARLVHWAAAVMSATGFSWCYLIVLTIGSYFGQSWFLKEGQEPLITMQIVEGAFNLGYLILVPGLLLSGTIIWVHSLMTAWIRKDLLSTGIAGWNTLAHLHNTFSALRGMPEAWRGLTGLLSGGGDARGKVLVIILILVVTAIVGGILTTWALINKYAGEALYTPTHEEFQEAKAAHA